MSWGERLFGRGKSKKGGESTSPVTPDIAADFKEGEINGVSISEVQRGIPLPNWESVQAVLNMYGSGRIESSLSTRLNMLQAYTESYGEDVLPILGAFAKSQGPTGAFIDSMMAEAKARFDEVAEHNKKRLQLREDVFLKKRARADLTEEELNIYYSDELKERWSKHYDYDGVGVFHKTSVEINKAPEGEPAAYVLEIWAAYVGDEPEKDLAQALGVERPTLSKAVTVEFNPQGDQFKIDMDAVAGRLATVFNNQQNNISGRVFADHFMSRDRYGHPVTEGYVLGELDGFKVALNFGRVGDHIDYRADRQKELWQREGNTLSGGLADDYKDESKYVAPSLVLSIVDAKKERYDTIPVISPERKATMQAVAQRLVDAFENSSTEDH